MPRVPVYSSPQVQPQPLPNVATRVNFPTVQVPDLGAPARAIAQGGEQLAATGDKLFQVAQRLQEDANRTAAKQATVNFDQFSRQTLMTGDGETPAYFSLQGEDALRAHDDVVQTLTKRRQETENTLANQRQRELFQDATQGALSHDLDKMAQYRLGQQRVYDDATSKMMEINAFENAVTFYNDPQRVAESLASGQAEIIARNRKNGSSPEVTAGEVRAFGSKVHAGLLHRLAIEEPGTIAKWYQEHAGAFWGNDATEAQKLVKSVDVKFQEQAAVDALPLTTGNFLNFAQAVAQVESGGRADARNPRSTATGAGQFIEATWLDVVKRHRTDLATGKSDETLLALRTDPALSREMTAAYARDNEAALREAGFEASPGNLYLAHFAGLAGAKRVLGAPADTSVEALLGPTVVDANPFLHGKTAANLQDWASRQMIGAPASRLLPVDQYLAPLAAIKDPVVRDGAERRARLVHANAEAGIKDQLEADKREAWAVIDRGGSPDDLDPDLRSRVTGTGLISQLWKGAERNLKRQEPQTDRELQYHLLRMSAENPETFQSLNLLDYRPWFASQDFEEMSKRQVSSEAKDAEKAARERDKTASMSHAMGLADKQLRAAGFDPTAKPGSPDAEAVAKFQLALSPRIEAMHDATGKRPGDKEILDLIGNLLQPGEVLSGLWYWNDPDKRAFQIEPEERERWRPNIVPTDRQRAQITKAFQMQTGQVPTKKDIAAWWAEYLLGGGR
ncbi:MAG: hypothetical protein FD150_2092 [Rhodobacteraceae bacterium]|nr:MAG: hypothetical protein FD150_2092 [Paracoccaceae bacterium]